jgi:hypothetical protein
MADTLFLMLAALVLMLVVFAFADCLKNRPPRWPLWLLFILLGLFPVSMEMASGRIQFEPFSILVLGIRIMKNGSEGWIHSVGIPLGAMIWIARHSSFVRRRVEH